MPLPLKAALLLAAGLSVLAGAAPARQSDSAIAPNPVSVPPDTSSPGNRDSVQENLPPRWHPPGMPPAIGATVLTAADLDFFPFRTTADLTGILPGVFTTGTGIGGVERGDIVHGLRRGGVVVLSGGMPLGDPVTGTHPLELFPVDASEAVVVRRGIDAQGRAPGAPGALLDLRPHSRRAPRPLSRVRYTQSSYGYSVLDGSLRQDVAKGVTAALGLQRPVSDGRFTNSALDAWMGRMEVAYESGSVRFHASDLFTRRERGLNDGVSLLTPDSLRFEPFRAVVNNASASEMLVRHDAAAGFAVGGGGAPLTTLDLRFLSSHREYRDEASGAGSTGAPFRETRREQAAGVRIAHLREIPDGTLEVGAEWHDLRLLSDPNIPAGGSTLNALSLRASHAGLSRVTIAPWARFDRRHDRGRFSAGGEVSLRIASGIDVVAGASRSHRHPTLAEARGVSGLALPLADPDPERHDLLTAGFAAGDSGTFRISINAYRRAVREIILLDSAAAGAGAPLAWSRGGTVSRRGVVASAAASFGPVSLEGSAEHISRGSGPDGRIAPSWRVDLGAYLRDELAGGHLRLKAGFRGRYFTARDGEAFSQRYNLHLPSGLSLPPAAVLDFLLFAGIGDAVVHLVWENLLDREYVTTVFHPMDDRAVRFGLSWNFVD